MKALIETSPDLRDRLKSVAARDGVPIKRAVNAILREQLPNFESGKRSFVVPECEIEEAAAADSKQAS